VFEATDQAFDFSTTDLASGEVERDGPSKRRLGGREPLRCSVPVAIKEGQRLAEQSRGPKQSVGLVRKEPPFPLATRHRPTRNVDEVDEALEGQRRVSSESFKCTVRKPFLHRTEEVSRIKCLESKQNHVRMWSRGAATQILPESIEILRGCLDAAMIMNGFSYCHLCAIWPLLWATWLHLIKPVFLVGLDVLSELEGARARESRAARGIPAVFVVR